MSNNYYNHTNYPTPGAPGSSAALRAELQLIDAGFDKLPPLTGNALKLVRVNAGATALEATTSLSGVVISGSTIDNTVIGGTTPAAGTFSTLAATSATVGGVNVATISGTQTLTNKTISGANNTITNIGNASLTNSSVTIGSTSVSLGATATTLAGLTSVSATTFTGALTGNATNVTGTVAIANGGTGATDAGVARSNLGLAIGTNVQAWDADLDSIAGLAGTSGLLRKTAANTWSLDNNSYLTGNQSISFSGDATGSGTTAVALTLANSGVGAGTYNNVTVDTKGRVTSGSNASYLTGNQSISLSGDATGSGATSIAVTLNTVPVNKGGTGATSASGARTNLLPTYTGQGGKVLAVNPGETDVEYITVAGTGTVTSVDVSGGTTGLTTSGGPISAAGTITLGGTLGVANGGTGANTLSGVVIGNGTSSFTAKANPSGDFVGTTDTQTLTNKTLTTPTLSGTASGTTAGRLGYATGVLSFGNGSAQKEVVTTDDTQTLTNKTFSGGTISGSIAGPATFTAQNTFGNASGQIFLAGTTTTNDGVIINGRAGGTGSFRVTIAPTTLTASRTLTLPDVSGTILTTGSTLDVANGGTGATSLTGVVIGNGTSAFTTKTNPSGDFVGTTDSQTLTNKTISVDSNTVSGVAASSFVLSNASGNIDGAAAQKAIPSGVVVGTTDTQTLTNKTLTSPRIGTSVLDTNGNELFLLTATASAVNELTVANATTGNTPVIQSSGGDTNVGFNLATKGTGLLSLFTGTNRQVVVGTVAGTAANYVQLTGSATGNAVSVAAAGTDTNISLNLVPKGTGTVQANGVAVVTLSGTQTLTNKTLTTPVISSISNSGTITIPTGTDTLVGRATTDTLSNKTLNGVILNDGYTEEVFAVTGTTPALSPANGSIQTWTLSGNSTPTSGTWNAGQSITLMIDDGSAFTVTWTSLAVTWKTGGGTAPTLQTTGLTAIALWKVGSTIYGARVGDA